MVVADGSGGQKPVPELGAVANTAELGAALRSLLRRSRESTGQKLTCRELANRSGYGHSSVSNWLAGRSLPSADRLGDLLVALGATAEEQRALATARDLIEECRRSPAPVVPGQTASRVPASPAPVPRELPSDVASFIGRADELAALGHWLLGTDPSGSGGPAQAPVAIAVVSGTAGVGKTALAVRWAHQVAACFPDGQLYINLRGYDPGQPVLAADALARFLRALGVADQDIPLETEERAVRYRSLTHGRRMLIVLDNAASAEQVRPLLPGSGPVTVATSRDALAGLVARDGAWRLELDLLPARDAVALLRALIGPRVNDNPAATAALAAACARLPLALRVAAELAAAQPSIALAELAAELAGQQDQLALLDAGGDEYTSVGSVLSWSYRYLPADVAATFRLLGLHPGADWDRYAAAALTGVPAGRIGEPLGVLTRAHLIQPAGGARYLMHDLLRGYAAGLAASIDSDQRRQAALTDLLDYYLAATSAAMDTLSPAEQHRRPDAPSGILAPDIGAPASALAWLDTERAVLAVITAYAADHGWPGHATRLAATLSRYLLAGGHYIEALAVQTHALRAASASDDRVAQAHTLTNLGCIYRRLGHYQQAAGHHEQALALARQAGDRVEEGRALGNLGNTWLRQGRYEQAADCFQQAIMLFRQIGDLAGEATGLDNLGVAYLGRGRFQQAAGPIQQALDLYREIGDERGEANALNNLGEIFQRDGRCPQAARYHRQALDLCQELGDRQGTAQTTINLGNVWYRQGNHQWAAACHRQALDLYREIGDRDGEACALNSLGEAQLAAGQPGHAHTCHAAASSLARETGDQHEQARALAGLGAVCHRQGQYRQAARYYRQALDLYREVGDRNGEATVLNRMAETLFATGQPGEAATCYTTALTLARQSGDQHEQLRARRGLRAISAGQLAQPAPDDPPTGDQVTLRWNGTARSKGRS